MMVEHYISFNGNLNDEKFLKKLLEVKPPCSPGCYSHVSHPCEKCGRFQGTFPKEYIESFKKRLKEMEEKRDRKNNIISRFSIMDLGEEVERKYRERIEEEYKKRVEEKISICEGCEGKEKCRWVRNGELYLCYDCFIDDLDTEASLMVPMRGGYDMEEYMTEGEWEDLWENENIIF